MKKSLFLFSLPLLLACGPFFFQAPPPISAYPERTPVIPWEQLLNENHSPSGEKKVELIDACRELVNSLGKSDNASISATIDDLQKRNRSGEFSIKIANFLIEFRELISANTDHVVIKPYLSDRVDNLKGGFKIMPYPVKTWQITDLEYEHLVEEYNARVELKTNELEHNIKEGPESLRPNYLVRRGAFYFRSGKSELAAKDFSAVVSAFPDHPRAEVARFMFGRCSLQKARSIKPTSENPSREDLAAWRVELRNADQAFRHYIRKYPSGAFVDDAEGWIGGVARDSDNLPKAINQQIKRLNLQPTREVAHSVMREIDSLLNQLHDENANSQNSYYNLINSIDYESLVQHPGVTKQFVYHCLDPVAKIDVPIFYGESAGGIKSIDFLKRKIIRANAFTQNCLTSLANAVAKSNAQTDELSALVLSWSLIRANDPHQALAITDHALAEITSDNLLQARAAALSKIGRHEESAQAYELLITGFPESPLSQPSRFDYAMELQRAGQAGKALIVLLDLENPDEDSDDGDFNTPTLHTYEENIQWIDTIAQFSPVNELRDALDNLPADNRHIHTLRKIVRTRLLCMSDFQSAKNYLDPPIDPDDISKPYYPNQWNPNLWGHLDRHRAETDAAALVEIYNQLPNASGNALQELHLKAAQHWQNLRGKLTLPLLATFDYSKSESEKIDQLRRANGRLLGIDDTTITTELDSRDELYHAFNHYLEATNGDNPSNKLTALFGANEALFRLAEFSPYRLSRAIEENHSALSHKLVEQMKNEFPDKELTKSAITYTFSPPATLRAWMPGDYNRANSDDYIDVAISGQNSFSNWRYRFVEDPEKEAIQKELSEISKAISSLASPDIEDPKAATESLRNRFTALRPKLSRREILSVVDDIDDLHAAAHAEGVTPELFRAYVPMRLQKKSNYGTNEKWQPLTPFFDYIDNIRMVDVPNSYYKSPNADTVGDWEAYLAKYPDGPKSEAALFRLVRKMVRSAIPIPHVEAFHFPDAPIANGYKTIEFQVDPTSATPEMLMASIEAYREKYPNGRYSMDINLLEASVLAASEKNAAALPLVTAVLDDPAHVEIRQDAALHFAAISLQLLNPASRAELIPAFRTTPNAMMYLERLANGNTCVSRVLPLIPALKENK